MLVSWQKLLSLLPDLKMHSTLPGELQLPQLDQLVVEVGITPGKYTQKKEDPQVKSASDQTKGGSIYV